MGDRFEDGRGVIQDLLVTPLDSVRHRGARIYRWPEKRPELRARHTPPGNATAVIQVSEENRVKLARIAVRLRGEYDDAVTLLLHEAHRV